jgi:hypothetical protein
MKKTAEISLHLNSVGQLLLRPDSLFIHKRKLIAEAEEFLIEEAIAFPKNNPLHLKIYLPTGETANYLEIESAIREHFLYLRKKSSMQLRLILNRGWRGLLASIIFLGLLILLMRLTNIIPESGLSVTLREILIILGWVALWRPADLLLYEWRPIKREINLFDRLANAKIEILLKDY